MEQRGDEFRALKILHFALLGGMTLAVIIMFVLRYTITLNQKFDIATEKIFQVIAVLLSLGGLLLGFNRFRSKVAALRQSLEPAAQRMAAYRTACIAWWALLEMPGLFGGICFFLTGNYAFFALALFQMSLLAVFMPRKENIIMLLNLNSDEVAKLEGKS